MLRTFAPVPGICFTISSDSAFDTGALGPSIPQVAASTAFSNPALYERGTTFVGCLCSFVTFWLVNYLALVIVPGLSSHSAVVLCIFHLSFFTLLPASEVSSISFVSYPLSL